MKLLSVTEKSCNRSIVNPPTVFTYEGATNSKTINGVLVTKQFLPWRLSKQIDKWGYYNGPNTNDNIAYAIIPPTTLIEPFTQSVITYGTAQRETVEASMLRGALKRVDYPNGGNTQYILEANDYPSTSESAAPLSPPLLLQTAVQPYKYLVCGQKVVSTNYTFINDPIGSVKFQLKLTQPDTLCSNQGNPITLVVKAYNNSNQQIGTSVGFNIQSGSRTTVLIPISQLIGSSPPIGTPITFQLTTVDGWGEFRAFNITSTAITKKVGGLRIKEVRTHDGIAATNDIVRTYSYRKAADPNVSSGNLLVDPKFGYVGTGQSQNGFINYVNFSANSLVPLRGF
ncbi:MAG: hypothetical protein IPN76_07430 [Saprospiraceae bacterium]|nr:hypothetical protein [Saprospiraceae bacterium]